MLHSKTPDLGTMRDECFRELTLGRQSWSEAEAGSEMSQGGTHLSLEHTASAPCI